MAIDIDKLKVKAEWSCVPQDDLMAIYGDQNPPTIACKGASVGKSENSLGIRFIVDPSLDKTVQDCQKRYSDSCLYFAPLNFEWFRFEITDDEKGGSPVAKPETVTIKAIPSLPEKAWHNELVRLCDQSAKGIMVHVASESQLDSVRETARRLRRPDIVFEVGPRRAESDEIEKI